MATIAALARATSSVTTSVSSAVMVRAMRGLLVCRGRAVVVDLELDAHRLLARVLFGDFGREPGDARDDEHEAACRRREAHVVQDPGKRAVDVHRQHLDAL